MKVLVCDDDARILDNITDMLLVESNSFQKKILTKCFVKCSEMLDYIDMIRGAVDLVILDIVFIDEDGISAARQIQEKYPNIKIIFITGYIEYAPDIFEVLPIYLLDKPIKQEKLHASLERAFNMMSSAKRSCIKIKVQNKIRSIKVEDIEYIESDMRKVIFHCAHEKISLYKKLSEVEAELSSDFVRCHQSYIVNTAYIREITKNSLMMMSGKVLPVSKSRYKNLLQRYTRYIKKFIEWTK